MDVKTIIVINKHRVASNRKKQNDPVYAASFGTTIEPVISVRRGKNGKSYYLHSVYIGEPCKLVYDPENPLPCGASVWIETNDDVLARYR